MRAEAQLVRRSALGGVHNLSNSIFRQILLGERIGLRFQYSLLAHTLHNVSLLLPYPCAWSTCRRCTSHCDVSTTSCWVDRTSCSNCTSFVYSSHTTSIYTELIRRLPFVHTQQQHTLYACEMWGICQYFTIQFGGKSPQSIRTSSFTRVLLILPHSHHSSNIYQSQLHRTLYLNKYIDMHASDVERMCVQLKIRMRGTRLH